MKDMQKTIDNITDVIENYNSSNNHHPEGLLTMSRNLASNLFFLEKFRAEKHKYFEATVYSLVGQGNKVNAATNEANVKIPELYMLRRIMTAAYKTLDIMRSELSYLKQEKHNADIPG